MIGSKLEVRASQIPSLSQPSHSQATNSHTKVLGSSQPSENSQTKVNKDSTDDDEFNADEMTEEELLRAVHDDLDLDLPEPLSQPVSESGCSIKERSADLKLLLSETQGISQNGSNLKLHMSETQDFSQSEHSELNLHMSETQAKTDASTAESELKNLHLSETEGTSRLQSIAGETEHNLHLSDMEECSKIGDSGLRLHLSESQNTSSTEKGTNSELKLHMSESQNTKLTNGHASETELNLKLSGTQDTESSHNTSVCKTQKKTSNSEDLVLKMSVSDDEEMEVDTPLDDSVIKPSDENQNQTKDSESVDSQSVSIL